MARVFFFLILSLCFTYALALSSSLRFPSRVKSVGKGEERRGVVSKPFRQTSPQKQSRGCFYTTCFISVSVNRAEALVSHTSSCLIKHHLTVGLIAKGAVLEPGHREMPQFSRWPVHPWHSQLLMFVFWLNLTQIQSSVLQFLCWKSHDVKQFLN